MSKTNRGVRSNPQAAPAAGVLSVLKALFAMFIVTALIASFRATTVQFQSRATEPKFELINFRDGSLSFSADQFHEELGMHDSIYAACFGGEPVQYVCYSFGGDLVETGTAVTTSAREAWPILDRGVKVDASSSRFGPAMRQVCRLASEHPNRVFGVLFQSDGDATDWADLDSSVAELAKLKNVAFVAITGAIPQIRLRLRQSMQPLGDRFIACDMADTNGATATKLAVLVARAGRKP